MRKTVLTERVETGQCPGWSVAIQADWTGQLLLEISKSLSLAVGAFSAIETNNSNKLVECGNTVV